MWHASARAVREAASWALAEEALAGVGDPALGEWREHGRHGVVHLRRRLTPEEAARAGIGCVRDVRGTGEEAERLAALVREAPHLRAFIAR